MTETSAELLTIALNSLDEQSLTRLLAPSCALWLSLHMQIRPINGWVTLFTREEGQIDRQAAIGSICTIARSGIINDVYNMAHALGLFGIWAGWFDQMTYVASIN